jgi:predicted MFS family arabinose efflux permease
MTPIATRSGDERSHIFRGWWIVLVSIAGLSFSLGAVLVYTFGVFAKPLASELKASRSSIALAVSLLDVVVAICAPGAGRMADRYGARRVIVFAMLWVSACLVSLAFVQPPLWHLYALYAAAGMIGVATTPVTYSRVIANWFDRKRGLALGLANAGVGLGAFITPSLAQFLIDRGGWRTAYLGLAAACLTISLPLVWIFLRARPEEVGLLPDGEVESGVTRSRAKATDGMTVREAFKTPTFWLLAFIFFCVAACTNGASAHLVPLLTDAGVSGRAAALSASIFGGFAIVGRVLNGYLVDRFFGPRVTAVLFGGAIVAVALLLIGGGVGAAFVAAALLGLAGGAEGDVMPYLVSRYFGMRSMAELYGCMFGAYTIGNAMGRYLFAASFDSRGSYNLPLVCAAMAIALAVAACFRLGTYRKPV